MKSKLHPNLTPLRKLFRYDVALDRQTPRMWLEILTNRHDVARHFTQVVHEFDYFFKGLSQADHDPALGQHAAVFAVTPGRSALQQCERLLINRVRSDASIESR